ncbi:Lipase maturation factor 2 [Plecturocebus cupreus]
MAGSRLPRQLFLQGVAAVFMFAFASLYTQIPGEGTQGGTPPASARDPMASSQHPALTLSGVGSAVQALTWGRGRRFVSCRPLWGRKMCSYPFPVRLWTLTWSRGQNSEGGLYGPEGILPARRTLRPQGKGRWQQLWETPTLLWEAPRLGLDTAQGLELLSLLGALLALGALLLSPLRHPAVYLLLWAAYLSACQASGTPVTSSLQPPATRPTVPSPSPQTHPLPDSSSLCRDSLLLETGFLAVLVAPLRPASRRKQAPQGGRAGAWPHEGLPFWLVRWLLFRLMFASGVVKLTSRCPAWWGLTALTYHYETQCLPTPAAWFAHQLPVWLHKLSVVATFLIEIAVSGGRSCQRGRQGLAFSAAQYALLGTVWPSGTGGNCCWEGVVAAGGTPQGGGLCLPGWPCCGAGRQSPGHRAPGCPQVLLQVLIIITGNYNFFNLMTLVLTTALLDDQHLAAEPGHSSRKKTATSRPKALLATVSLLLELAVYGFLAYGTVHYFGLEVDWQQRTVHSRTTFTFHQFSQWLKTLTLPTVWLGVASLAWELLSALWRWTQVRGWLRKLSAAVQLSLVGTATVALFLISLVPYSYVEPGTHGRLWTGAHRLFGTVEHLQLANSYGLFRRMTGLGGRPEVVLEGSYDGHHWTEIEFMYKPGNLSRPPPVVVPHQPRLDWQMWFAALGQHTHSPWFTSLVLRLLQGKEPVIRLIQSQVARYPFHEQPPTYIRAQRYKYWFSQPGEHGQWWRRQWVEEFFPPVSLGDPMLEMLLRQFGLQDKNPPRARGANSTLAQALHWTRTQLSALEAPALLWGLLVAVGAVRVVRALLAPWSLWSSLPALAIGEKHRPAPQKDSGATSEQATPTPSPCSSSSRTTRRKK